MEWGTQQWPEGCACAIATDGTHLAFLSRGRVLTRNLTLTPRIQSMFSHLLVLPLLVAAVVGIIYDVYSGLRLR